MKLYLNEAWLKRRLVVQKRTLAEVAKECGVAELTIRRAAEKFGIRLVKW
jgi:DNA-binding MurR/RpiR family transcriptional regulator